MANPREHGESERDLDRDADRDRDLAREREPEDDAAADAPNPPRTTRGGITAPKFGSAGGGGAELEPGPERD
jgi:hypothetical protein